MTAKSTKTNKATNHDAPQAPAQDIAPVSYTHLDVSKRQAQEYMCEFLDSSNVLLPYDLIATAESASATVSCDPAIYLLSLIHI